MGFSYPGKFKSLTINAGSYYDCDGICRKTLTHVEEVSGAFYRAIFNY